MRRRRVGWVLVVATTLLVQAVVGSTVASGQSEPDPPRLLSAGPATDSDDDTTARSRPVRIDTTLLDASQHLSLELNLFADVSFEADLSPAPSGAPGWQHWNGELVGVADSFVSVIRKGADVSALVQHPGATYRIQNKGAGNHTVSEIEQQQFPSELEPLTAPNRPSADAAPNDEGASSDPVPAGDPAGIDVLVVYTPEAKNQAGGKSAIEAEAAEAIAVTNSSFNTSAINARVRLAAAVELSDEITVGSGGLSQLTNTNDGVADEVHDVRDYVKADLVAAIAWYTDGGCGIGWLLTQLSTSRAPYGFTVTDLDCAVSNLSFPHELGHNMGAHHDRYVANGQNSLFPYGYGYVNAPDRWRTIMAYNDQCAAGGFTCTRLARFSNPSQTLNGDPVGVPIGQSNAADNRTALNTSASYVAGFRAAAPVARAGADRRVNKGSEVTLDGSGSYDPEGRPLTYRWVQIGGPTVVLRDDRTARAKFTAPGTKDVTMRFRLTVSDGTGASTADEVAVTTK